MNSSKRILVAPLNWGLGHATRCIPIIQELLAQKAEVVLASDGRALELLKKEFPELKALKLPAYNIQYVTGNMFFNIAYQLPKIIKAVIDEKRMVQKIVKEFKIDAIISDNRFGCRSKEVRSVFMTHQLRIKMPIGFLENWVASINHSFINKFDQCWIPDVEGSPNLSGILSHNISFPNLHFIGVLSRMEYEEIPKKYDAVVVLSGPEPQRTFLEKKIIRQLEQIPGHYLIVQGKTESEERIVLQNRITITSFMIGDQLNKAMLASDLVISRSGYSTIMDLAKLEKKAILIPTPGQTEQESLAEHFKAQNIFYCQSQEQLNLEKALLEVERYSGLNKAHFINDFLNKEIRLFLNSI